MKRDGGSDALGGKRPRVCLEPVRKHSDRGEETTEEICIAEPYPYSPFRTKGGQGTYVRGLIAVGWMPWGVDFRKRSQKNPPKSKEKASSVEDRRRRKVANIRARGGQPAKREKKHMGEGFTPERKNSRTTKKILG